MIRGFIILIVLAALRGSLLGELIAISATASPDYVRRPDPAGGARPETYVFVPGHFIDGSSADGSLTRLTFGDITKLLAPNLAKQRYYPTKDLSGADLVIVVHWGTTQVYEDPQREHNIERLNETISDYNAAFAANGIADPSPINSVLSDQDASHDFTLNAVNRNAVLLGYASTLRHARRFSMATAEERDLSAELNEERYFVVLMAYDRHSMAKGQKSHLLWSTRLSVRSPGRNFLEAMPELSRAGAEVFGHQLDNLVRVNERQLREGHVTLREMQILGTVKPEPEAPQK